MPISGALKPEGMHLNQFAIIPPSSASGKFRTWSLPYLNLTSLPTLNVKSKGLSRWLNPHAASMMAAKELKLRKNPDKGDELAKSMLSLKESIHAILVSSAGVQGGSVKRVFALQQEETRANSDTVIFVNYLCFDLSSNAIICDAYVLPLTVDLLKRIQRPFSRIVVPGQIVWVPLSEGARISWKRMLPALAERCRVSWEHGDNCEYNSSRRIPLTEEKERDPLCSCGRGKDVSGMLKVPEWRPLASHVTRIALNPLYAVSYLEAVGRDPALRKCSLCRGKGNPRLKECTGCRRVRYCSSQCQKKDWKSHKPYCKV